MLAVVKKHHIRIQGENLPSDFLKLVKNYFGELEIEDDELTDLKETNWYKKIKKGASPGKNMRAYREMREMTQEQLGKLLGNKTRQNISAMENGHRAISKETAKKLAEIFETSVTRFI